MHVSILNQCKQAVAESVGSVFSLVMEQALSNEYMQGRGQDWDSDPWHENKDVMGMSLCLSVIIKGLD